MTYVTPKMTRDEFIAMKMLTCYKQLKRVDKNKPHPDIGWMQEILEVSRRAGVEFDTKQVSEQPKESPHLKETQQEKSDRLFRDAQRFSEDCFDPTHARAWADALART